MAGQRVSAWRVSRPFLFAVALLCAGFVAAEDPAPATEEPAAAAADAVEEENDETKQLLSQLTISMVAEVVDERTFVIRDTTAKGRKLLRLGNTAGPAKGSLSDDEHKEKVEASKGALTKLLGKQMIWWKAAPDAQQPGGDSDTVVGDVWMIDGRHINSLLKKEGHLEHVEEYKEELARNILTAEADEKKRESYKELEEALKESEKAKRQAEKEAKKQEEMKGEPIGFGGIMGLVVLAVIVGGAMMNFGRESKKKVNLNRKRGPLERLWIKLKGA